MIQINPYSSRFREFLKYLGWILLFAILWVNGCSGKSDSVTTITATVPAINGSFWIQKPKHTPIETTKKSPVDEKENYTNSSLSTDVAYLEMTKENEKLKQDFDKANDSIRKLKYYKAVQLNAFSSTFENDIIKIDFNGIVQGEVKSVTPSYTIKERKIEVPVKAKETTFRLLAGMEVGNNTALNDFKAKANVMFQNKKGNILTTSFDTNQTVWVGYNISIFNIKR